MKPCLICGELVGSGSRCPDCRPKRPGVRSHPYLHTSRWTRTSARIRSVGFCEHCGATEELQAGHIIPASERPDLIFVTENLRCECGTCNRRRSNTCTDDERQMVHEAIAARKARRARHHISQNDG